MVLSSISDILEAEQIAFQSNLKLSPLYAPGKLILYDKKSELGPCNSLQKQ